MVSAYLAVAAFVLVEITSVPEDIVAGVSQIRNPVLARVLSEMNLMEEWGSGLRRVVKSLADSGLPAPDFVELPGQLRVVVHIANHQPSIDLRQGADSESSEHVSEHVRFESGPHSHAILSTAAASPLRREDLLSAVGLTNAYGNYRRNIVPLVEAGLLERTEPERLRSTAQRYRLTKQGRLYLRRVRGGEG